MGIATGDFDGDQNVDFAVADPGEPTSLYGGNVTVFLASSAGRYFADKLERVPEEGRVASSPRVLAVDDLDGDGRLEIISGDDGSHDLAIYRPTEPGAFDGPASVFAESQSLAAPFALTAADLDGNGLIDLLTPNFGNHDITAFFQTGSADFAALSIPLEGSPGPVAVACGDVDGDGRADLVAAELESDDVAVLLQDSSGGFSSRVSKIRDDALLGPYAVALSDLSGDGRLDIVAAGRFSSNAVWFEQGTDGSFGRGGTFQGGAGSETRGPVAVAAADLDLDGTTDVMLANQVSENVVAFFRGASSTVLRLPGVAGERPTALQVADVDLDGRPDVVVSNLGATAVAIFRQTGPRSFERSALAAESGYEATGVAVQDLNGDGKPDLVASFANDGDSFLRLYFQKTAGGFDASASRRLESPDLAVPVAVLAIDLDGDGEADVVTANRMSRNVTAFFGGR